MSSFAKRREGYVNICPFGASQASTLDYTYIEDKDVLVQIGTAVYHSASQLNPRVGRALDKIHSKQSKIER